MGDPISRRNQTRNRLRAQIQKKRESLADQFDFKIYIAFVFKDKVSIIEKYPIGPWPKVVHYIQGAIWDKSALLFSSISSLCSTLWKKKSALLLMSLPFSLFLLLPMAEEVSAVINVSSISSLSAPFYGRRRSQLCSRQLKCYR